MSEAGVGWEHTLTLNSGHKIPLLGLGTWRSKDPLECTSAVKASIVLGYRHIDCAAVYENETHVGQGIAEALKELEKQGKNVTRKDLFITSKLWGNMHEPARVKAACLQTIKDLGVGYLDLYLIHWPMALRYVEGDMFPEVDGKADSIPVPLGETWKAMEELVKEGLVKSIGLSNCEPEDIDEVLAVCTIKPAMNQVEVHPYLSQGRLREYCSKHGIAITAYSPLGNIDPLVGSCLQEPVVISLGEKYGRTPAQILLRFDIQLGCIVIPKSVSPKRLEENGRIFDFLISEEDMNKLLTCRSEPLRMCEAEYQPRWFK